MVIEHEILFSENWEGIIINKSINEDEAKTP